MKVFQWFTLLMDRWMDEFMVETVQMERKWICMNGYHYYKWMNGWIEWNCKWMHDECIGGWMDITMAYGWMKHK